MPAPLGSEPTPAEPLTRREQDCLDAYGELWSYRAVADRLGIAYYTVSKHLANARSKLGTRKTAEAVRQQRAD